MSKIGTGDMKRFSRALKKMQSTKMNEWVGIDQREKLNDIKEIDESGGQELAS